MCKKKNMKSQKWNGEIWMIDDDDDDEKCAFTFLCSELGNSSVMFTHLSSLSWTMQYSREVCRVRDAPGGGGTQVERGIWDVPRNRVPFSPSGKWITPSQTFFENLTQILQKILKIGANLWFLVNVWVQFWVKSW